MKRASCGLDVHSPVELNGVLNSASENGFEFVCLPLAHPRFKREFTARSKDRIGPFTRPDLVLKSNEWSTLIAAKISPYINVELEGLCDQAKHTLEQELNYGSHLGVPAVIIPLRSSKCNNFARYINANLSGVKPCQIWVEVPLISYAKEAAIWRSNSCETQEESTWEWWNTFRTLCNSDKRLGVILEVSKKLPGQKELDRWIGEPIKCLVLSTSIFLTNKKGYPVLSKDHQLFIKSLVPFEIQVIIKGNNHHHSIDCYQKYINHLWQEALVQEISKLQETPSSIDSVESAKSDLLPVSNELYKKDYFKYKEYKKAIQQALLDKVPDNEKDNTILNVMIVDAGRGSLVSATLCAASEADRKVKIYAVEENPHAVVSLEADKEELWGSSVEIISKKIKNFSHEMDIILSESLGSIGDNELSPEIFDEVQGCLKDGGICIPQSYTSYLCPVQSSKIYSDLKEGNCETPYVAVHKNKYNISREKPLFSFSHPNYSLPIDNSRYKTLTFKTEQNCILHGFTGCFETVLYKDIKLSTVPETQTPGLLSWRPVFFPLAEPVHLKGGCELEVHFWRVVGDLKVWYEWTITKPIPLQIHNPNGRSSSIPLPEN